MISINATPVTATEKNKTVTINTGQKASFSGFLVPEWQFRKINQDLIEKDMLLGQVQAAQLKDDEETSVETFLWGFLAGSATILVIDKLGSR